MVAGLVELREGVELPEAFRNLLELMSRLDFGERHFGHAGERALNALNPYGFKHYVQSVRVVQKLEKDHRGLNLTYEVLDGMEQLSLVCIDNIECIAGDELWEMAIFDLYNRILESGKTRLLITGDRPPRQLKLGKPTAWLTTRTWKRER